MAHENQNQLNDAVVAFYYDITPDHQYNDTLYEALTDLGYTGALQDMQFQWLGDGGYTGTLNDRMLAWSLDQNGVASGQINDQLLEYYIRDHPPHPDPEGDLVVYEGAPVWYQNQTNFVVFVEL